MESKPMPVPMHGKCNMCGGTDRDLWMLFIGDYAGWTCAECLQQVSDSQERKFLRFLEQTEPAE